VHATCESEHKNGRETGKQKNAENNKDKVLGENRTEKI